MQDSLLIELLTEELPPKSLIKLSQAFCQGIFEGLKGQGFVAADADYAGFVSEFATPRRLGVLVKDVAHKQSERIIERKGPALASAYDQNEKPTPALIGFAKSCGVEISALQKQSDKKGEHFVFRAKQPGEMLEKHLAGIVASVIKKLPVAKLMRWGGSEVEFVRPVHGLMMLHGKKIVHGEVLGQKSSNTTSGHRFLSGGDIVIAKADDYERMLEEQGNVVASFEKRKQAVAEQIKEKERELEACVITHDNIAEFKESVIDDKMKVIHEIMTARDALCEEVTALIEYPTAYVGGFSEEFLVVPAECLILSMRQHQRYFPIFGRDAELQARFLFISNQKTDQPENIIHGNERVLRARLSDAKFFFEQDKKTKLEERVPKLANVVYHNKLGSQLQRVERIRKLAVAIAERLKEIKFAADIKHVERAAYLCKADLLTDMVGEFPELQGVMGYYYALHDGEAPQVAEAIREHYERVSVSAVGICVGLADKLDTLVGIYGIGLIPTGDKDPFGLRRAALGVLRTLVENKLALNLMQLLEIAEGQFPSDLIEKDTVSKLYDFMLERLKPYLREQEYRHDEIEAVLSLRPTRMDWIVPRLKAIQEFRKMPEAESLAAANKRIRNILKQAQREPMEIVNASLLKQDEEKHLAQHLALLEAEVMPLIHHGEYTQALKHLASLRPAVDAFFDKVMVMAEDAALRDNRLALLTKLEGLFMRVADISKLQYGVQQS
ncbi:MAG: glycine--tRNA ligase subunit beta [Gammaproteobacteria bacterium]|nr:glycine--tRNA ligase subunit beta [Gammaproteobacteria bacterium]